MSNTETLAKQLTQALSLTRAVFKATADGIVVTDRTGAITDFNDQYLNIWPLPNHLLHGHNLYQFLQAHRDLLIDADAFLAHVDAIIRCTDPETSDIVRFTDGRTFKCSTHVQQVADEGIGRVWNLCDITRRVRAEQALQEETRTLELLNKTGMVLTSKLDAQAVLQAVTDAATQLTRAQFGAFFYNTEAEAGKTFMRYALSGAPPEAFVKFPMPRATTSFGPTFSGERIVRIADVLDDPTYGKSSPHFGMPEGHLPVRSYLAVPVISRSGVAYGGLFFGHAQPGVFTERDELMTSSIAAQAAVAIDNARLFASNEQTRVKLQKFNAELTQGAAQQSNQLHRSEQQLAQVIAGITDCAIYMLDQQGLLISWNPGAEFIKGYRAEEVIGRHFSMFFTEADRISGVPQHAMETAKRTGKYESEAWRVRKDGTHFWASVLLDAIYNEDGSLLGFAKITRDMTERRALQEQLHQSQKMEAIGQMTGGVAHDFNNLLTVILGNLEYLNDHVPADQARLRRSVDQATRGAQRAATLTQQLLAFARRQPLNPKPTNVNRLVTGMSDLVRKALHENIAIESVLGGGIWNIEVDPHQLESALLNLAMNARDAMPQGGKLSIHTSNVSVSDDQAWALSDLPAGEYVLICVNDNGIGMSEEILARAFEPFYTTKALGEGTGLGLSQVYGFVKQSGGHIKLHSEKAQGTTVKIYLPRLISAATDSDMSISQVLPKGKVSECILVVEDDNDVRSYSVDTLQSLGFTVLEAPDAASALRLLKAHPEINLLFTDVGLPGMNGRQLVDAAIQQRPDLLVLFTTGYERDTIVHQGRLDSGVELLTKPFARAQLASRIRDILDANKH